MVLGYGGFFVTALRNLLTSTLYIVFLVAVLYGAYVGVVETVQRALIPDYVGEKLKGTAYRLYYLVVGSAFFVSNSVVGSLWELFGSSVACGYIISLSAVAIVAIMLFVRKKM